MEVGPLGPASWSVAVPADQDKQPAACGRPRVGFRASEGPHLLWLGPNTCGVLALIVIEPELIARPGRFGSAATPSGG